MDSEVVIMQDDQYNDIKRILWPTSEDLNRVRRLTLDRPPAADMQSYYIEDLDRSEAKQIQMDSFIVMSQQHLLNTLKSDVQRSQENWFHALLFNFDRCNMSMDLQHAIEFICTVSWSFHLTLTLTLEPH